MGGLIELGVQIDRAESAKHPVASRAVARNLVRKGHTPQRRIQCHILRLSRIWVRGGLGCGQIEIGARCEHPGDCAARQFCQGVPQIRVQAIADQGGQLRVRFHLVERTRHRMHAELVDQKLPHVRAVTAQQGHHHRHRTQTMGKDLDRGCILACGKNGVDRPGPVDLGNVVDRIVAVRGARIGRAGAVVKDPHVITLSYQLLDDGIWIGEQRKRHAYDPSAAGKDNRPLCAALKARDLNVCAIGRDVACPHRFDGRIAGHRTAVIGRHDLCQRRDRRLGWKVVKIGCQPAICPEDQIGEHRGSTRSGKNLQGRKFGIGFALAVLPIDAGKIAKHLVQKGLVGDHVLEPPQVNGLGDIGGKV